MHVGGQRHALATLPVGRRPSTHWTGASVPPTRASLYKCEVWKILPPLSFDSWTVQPIRSQCIDFTIPAHHF